MYLFKYTERNNVDPIEQRIGDFFSALCRGDIEAWMATFSADASSHDPVGTPPHIGHPALRQFFVNVSAAFKSLEIAAEDVMVCGSRGAAKWRATGVGQNGRTVKFTGIDVFEMDAAGKIKTLWGFWDPSAMFAELNG